MRPYIQTSVFRTDTNESVVFVVGFVTRTSVFVHVWICVCICVPH